MKLWIDDLREAPEDWAWLKTSESTIARLIFLKHWPTVQFEAISLDHDLGGDDTTRPVVLWMAENDFWPEKVYVHSMNNVGREWLIGMVNRYGPGVSR